MMDKAVRGYAVGRGSSQECLSLEIEPVQAAKLSLLLVGDSIDGLGPKVEPGRQNQIQREKETI